MENSPRRTELYYRVIDAFRAKIPEDISPDDPEYEDVWKAELRAAYNMAWAWVWYIQEGLSCGADKRAAL